MVTVLPRLLESVLILTILDGILNVTSPKSPPLSKTRMVYEPGVRVTDVFGITRLAEKFPELSVEMLDTWFPPDKESIDIYPTDICEMFPLYEAPVPIKTTSWPGTAVDGLRVSGNPR